MALKLKSQQSKDKKPIIIIVSVIVAIALVIGIVSLVIGIKYPYIFDMMTTTTTQAPPPTVMTGISVVNMPTKLEYEVGEEFDPTGTRVQANMNKQSATYFVDYTQLEFSGFDSSEPNDNLKITVSYKGFEASFTVVIKEPLAPDPTLESIRLSDNFVTTYTLTEWNKWGPDFYGVKIICTYSDGHEEEVSIKATKHCDGIDQNLTSAGTTQFTVKYEGLETTVTVTITN